MAGNRSITVTLRANVQDFKSQFDAATKAAESTAKATEQSAKQSETAMGRMVQSAQNNRQAWDTAGATLTGFGAATLGALGLATKAAMDWESAWAGVQKTVEGTDSQMVALEAGLRGMARELPATHQEIAAVAEAAGQLGIATPNILGFTRTMIDMGEATNLSADEAATALARFITVTGTSQSDIGRLGATVVGLGNNFATTEAEIVALSQRLAAAGTQAGMSEGEIMGMATAMSQVGIEAEAGGSAMTQSLNRMSKAVEEGGESLELFAAVSGMSADQFTAAWESDPAQALVAFTEGLADTSALGMSTNAVLTELGITGLREADVMRRLALATGTMSDAMAMGNSEFESGMALIDEASKRYETAESRIAMARNALVDAGISIGSVVLPAFANLADGVGDVAGWFADLPGPVHATVAGLAGVAGAASLGAGSFLLIAPRVLDTVSAFRDLGAISPGTASKVGRLTLGIGKLGVGVAALAAVPPILNAVSDAMRGIDNADFDLGMNELTSSLLEAERSGKVFDSVLGDMYESGALNKKMFSDLGGTITEVSNINWFQNLVGPLAATGINDAKDRLEGLSDAFTLLAQTDLEKATSTFSAFIAEAEAGGATFAEVMEVMPSFRDHLVGVAEAMGVGTDDATLYKIATGELSPVVDEATGAVTGFAEGVEEADGAMTSAADAAVELYDKMTSLADGFLNARQKARNYKESLIEAKDVLKENGKAWGDSTEKARENGEALDGVAQSVLDNAEAMRRNGEDVGEYLQGQREILWDLAKDFGATDEEATAYVNSLGLIPEDIDTMVRLETEAAIDQWNLLWDDLGYHPPLLIDPTVDPEGKVTEFTGLVSTIPPETHTAVGVETDESVQKMYGFAEVVEGATEDQTVAIDADPSGAILGADEAKAALDSIPHVTRTESGLDIGPLITQADRANLELAYLEAQKPTPTADLNDTQLIGVASAAVTRLNEIDGMTPTPELEAEAGVLRRVVSESQGRINGMTGKSVDVTAHAQGFSGVSNLRAEINRLAGKTVTVRTNFVTSGRMPRTSGTGPMVAGFAAGGAIHGLGTGTSDSIPAYLSNGEHVITAKEVAMAGGQDAIYRMREAIRSGYKFAEGGAVGHGSHGPAMSMVPVQRSQQVSASVDSGVIASAVASAMSSWQPLVNIGDRDFVGVMRRAERVAQR